MPVETLRTSTRRSRLCPPECVSHNKTTSAQKQRTRLLTKLCDAFPSPVLAPLFTETSDRTTLPDLLITYKICPVSGKSHRARIEHRNLAQMLD